MEHLIIYCINLLIDVKNSLNYRLPFVAYFLDQLIFLIYSTILKMFLLIFIIHKILKVLTIYLDLMELFL
jgi:hypothetical protein